MTAPSMHDKRTRTLATAALLLVVSQAVSANATPLAVAFDATSTVPDDENQSPYPTPPLDAMLEELGLDAERDSTLLRMLDRLGALPTSTAQMPIASHVLGLAAAAPALPALYEARALSSETPLRTALIAYNDALDLMSPRDLVDRPELRDVDDLPLDAQVAIAVLVYALTDASLLQKQAIAGLSPDDYASVLAVPSALLDGSLDPERAGPEADDAFASAAAALLRVDRQRIDEAALIMAHAVSHAMPALEAWGERARAQQETLAPAVEALSPLLSRYAPSRIDGLDHIERLDLLAETLAAAAALQGLRAPATIEPLAPPAGDEPLRAALLAFADTLGNDAASSDASLARFLDGGDQLPRSLQHAVARIVVNQDALVRAAQDFSAVLSVLDERAADAAVGSDPATAAERVATALAELRRAEIRVVRAIQQSAPMLDAWGLYWRHHGQAPLPVTAAQVPGRLQNGASLAADLAAPTASLEEIVRLAATFDGITVPAAPPPPLPERGALADAVIVLYASQGLEMDDASRASLLEAVHALPPAVERNAARVLLAQLDALASLNDLHASFDARDIAAFVAGPGIIDRLLSGETLSVSDAKLLRAHYELAARIEGTYLDAASRIAAAVDAASSALDDFTAATHGSGADARRASGQASESPANVEQEEAATSKRPWYQRLLSPLLGFELVGTASAQSAPGEPYTLPVSCPSSPLADCANDVWFMDPILQTVVISGFETTEFDPRRIGRTISQTSPIAGDDRVTELRSGGQMLTIALGGDDVYRNNAGGAGVMFTQLGSGVASNATLPDGTTVPISVAGPRLAATTVAVALDLGGDDSYLVPPADFEYPAIQGAASGGIGMLVDRRGEDRWAAREHAQGFGTNGSVQTGAVSLASLHFGLGLLVSGDGNDRFEADAWAQGAGSFFGMGLLVSQGGDDRYLLKKGNAQTPAVGQGGAGGIPGSAANVGGVGILVDAAGSDRYHGGQQGRGRDGGVGFFFDVAGGDRHSRPSPSPSGSWDWNGKCWASARAPPRESVANLNQSVANASAFADSVRNWSDVPNAPSFVQNATVNATRVAGEAANATLIDGQGATANATQGHGLFLDFADDDGCQYDPSPLVPDVSEISDPQALVDDALQTLADLGGGVNPVADPIVDVAGTLVLGGSGPNEYTGDYAIAIDLGGANTHANNAGSEVASAGGLVPGLLLNVDRLGDDSYLAPERTCVQGCNGMLIDLGGNDQFLAGATSQGVARTIGMLGVLFSGGGDTRYTIASVDPAAMAQGSVNAPAAGLALLLDVAGNDTYRSPTQGAVDSRAVGGAAGTAAIVGVVVAESNGLFLDLSGDDVYQPAGRQGHLQFEYAVQLDGCCDFEGGKSKGGGLAAFVDGGGSDHYVGTPAQPAGPDVSDYYNGRARAQTHTGVHPTHAIGGAALFWDVTRSGGDRDGLAAVPTEASDLRLGPLGIAIGSPGDNEFDEDYALLIHPGGNNVYRNNAGGTLLRVSRNVMDSGGKNSALLGTDDWTTAPVAEASLDPARNHPLAALLIDLAGEDRYVTRDLLQAQAPSPSPADATKGFLVQGAGFLGVGMLIERAGNDTYSAHSMGQGFGLYGWGILWDQQGDDVYAYDPAVVQRPVVDGNLMGWIQHRPLVSPIDELAAVPTTAVFTPWAAGGASAGTWEVRLRAATWAQDCALRIAGETGPFSDVAVSRGATDRLLVSAYNRTEGVWRVFRVPDIGPECDAGGLIFAPSNRVAAYGASNPPSNQVNPQFATGIASDDDVLWQDDRDGTWSLYSKRLADASSMAAQPLEIPNASESNQTNPHVHGSWVIYEDDRRAGTVCPSGTSSIYRFNVNSQTEELLSAQCGIHAKPKISEEFAVWQTRAVDAAGVPQGGWNLTVYPLTGVNAGQPRPLVSDGDQHDAIVAGDTILYANWTPTGGHNVGRYFWGTNTTRVEREGAIQPALDPKNPSRAVWIDTHGRDAPTGAVVGTSYWEIHRRTLAEDARSALAGPRVSSASSLSSQWMQGAAYLAGRGVVLDQSGRDSYAGDRFAQGSSASLVGPFSDFKPLSGCCPSVHPSDVDAYGLLADLDGNDRYTSRHESQGTHFAREFGIKAGTPNVPGPGGPLIPATPIHDTELAASVGLLLDMRGNDAYAANRQSQGFGAMTFGAGSTMSGCAGLNANTPCNPLRGYLVASQGLFTDLGGSDIYRYAQQQLIHQRVSVGTHVCDTAEQTTDPTVSAILGLDEALRQTFGPLVPGFNTTFNQMIDPHYMAAAASIGSLLNDVLTLCRVAQEAAQDAGGDDVDVSGGAAGPRNNEVWRQKSRRGPDGSTRVGDAENGDSCSPTATRSADGQLSPCPPAVHVGGIGLDLPAMDNMERALTHVADEIIVVEVAPSNVVPVGGVFELTGPVGLEARAQFVNGLFAQQGLRLERVEFFVAQGDAGFELLAEDDAPSAEAGKMVFRAPWRTPDFADGSYNVSARVHYGHSLGFPLGFSQKVVDELFVLDNPPRITEALDLPFVADERSPAETLLDFSPAPHASDANGHALVTFDVSSDPRVPGGDAWMNVTVADASGLIVRTLLETTLVSAGQTVSTIWDGTDEDGGVVPSGRYMINISASDRPGASAAGRTASLALPLNVYSYTPYAGCVLAPGSASCNGARFLNENTPGAITSVGGVRALTVALPLQASTENGTAPPGLEKINRYHVRVGTPTADGSVTWDPPETLAAGARSYELTIPDGGVRHVVILAEDRAGNLECAPACAAAGLTDFTVQRDQTGAQLASAFARKLQMGTFPAGWPAAGAPVYATFIADLVPPLLGKEEVTVNGQLATSIPRVGAHADIHIQYQILEESGTPTPVVRGWSDANASFTFRHTSADPSVGVAWDTHHVGNPARYNATWAAWPSLVNPPLGDPWPEGLVTVRLAAEDRAGNTIPQRDQVTRQFVLDRTPPQLRGIEIGYPGGRTFAEDGDLVRLLVDAFDPEIGIWRSEPGDLRLAINASRVTSEAPTPGSCTLQFHRSLCLTPDGKWETFVPINASAISGFAGLQSATFNVTITVADLAGNSVTREASIAIGSPIFRPRPVAQEVALDSIELTWTVDAPAEARLEWGAGTDVRDLRNVTRSPVPNGTHTFRLANLTPGTAYVYRFVATDPNSNASEGGSLQSFQTLRGVRLDLVDPRPSYDGTQVLSGVYRVHGGAYVESDPAAQARVVLRLIGPGLPPSGRNVFDGFAENARFEMDLVTDALEDGVFSLQATASHLAEPFSVTVNELLVDNTAPQAQISEPAPGARLTAAPTRVLVRVAEELTPIAAARAQLKLNGVPLPATPTFTPDSTAHDGVIEFSGLPPMSPGDLRFDVSIEDGAGNSAHAVSRFLYDATPPDGTLVRVAYPAGQQAARAGQWVQLYVEPSLASADLRRATVNASALEGAAEISLRVDASGRHAVEVPIPASQPDGELRIAVTLEDRATNAQKILVPVLVDSTPPRRSATKLSWLPAGSDEVVLRVEATEPVTVSALLANPATAPLRAQHEKLATLHVLRLIGVHPGVNYVATVTLRDGAGNELLHSEPWHGSTTLAAPAVERLAALVDAEIVHLSWQTDPESGSRFLVYRAANGSFELIAEVAETRHRDANVTPGTSYRYFVQAVVPSRELGRPSDVVTATVPPGGSSTRVDLDIHPREGFARETRFIFTAQISDGSDADVAMWLILDGEPRRMQKDAREDCRVVCTFLHATELDATQLAGPEASFYVEGYGATANLRSPAAGGMTAPIVLSRNQPDTRSEIPMPPLTLLLIVAAATCLLVAPSERSNTERPGRRAR